MSAEEDVPSIMAPRAPLPVSRVAIASLHEDPANARAHGDRNLDSIAASLSAFGQVEPLVVQRSSMKVIGGNGRLVAMKRLGWTEADVVLLDVDDVKATQLGIALNRTAELATWDDGTLAKLLESLSTQDAALLVPTGFSADELADLLASTAPAGGPVLDPDAVLPDAAITKPGDMWAFPSGHRLVCGDSTKEADVRALFSGNERVDALVTDPPYGINYAAKNAMLNRLIGGDRNTKTIASDDKKDADLAAFLESVLKLAPMAERNTLYVFAVATGATAAAAAAAAGFTQSTWLAWVKNNHAIGYADYAGKHELILYGWKGVHDFHGPFRTTVLEYDRPTKNDVHPTMKPVALIAQLVTDGTQKGDLVYDPFGGSGSTLLACEQTGRVCFTMELEPRYCDVIVQRYKSVTGNEPMHVPATVPVAKV